MTYNSINFVGRAIELRGATVAGVPAHLKEVIGMVSSGELSVKAESISFADIPNGLERLKRGEVNGRLIAILG